jgi:hypothetical protein
MVEHAYTLTFEDRGSYLYVYLAGADSFAASLSYWNEIVDRVRKFDFRRLLFHENLLGDVNEGELYDILMDILPAPAGLKIAFYDENKTDEQINELGQLIAANRGANIRIFQSLESAQDWIMQDD